MQIDKIEGADSKYDNIFFLILAQKYTNKAFLVSNLGIFIISQNFAMRQVRKCWFQMWQNCFRITSQKYPNKAFLVPNSGIFVSSQKFAIRQIRECWFQIWQWLFWIPARKYRNKAFFMLNVISFYFCVKRRILKNSRVLISKTAIAFFR